MRQYFGLDQINHEDDDLRGGAVTIGNFDGVHLGHQRILEHLIQAARRVAGPAVAITFDPAPAAILRPEQAGGRLTPIPERLRLLRRYGVDAAIVVRPDPSFLSLGPEVFIRRVLVDNLHARAVVEGPDWRFGKKRAGDIQLLTRLGDRYEYEVVVVHPLQTKIADGKPVALSSTVIRWLLAAGDLAQANRLLGRPYVLFGTVVKGAGRGTTLGFPTVNLDCGDQVVPADGIYAGRCQVNGSWVPAAMHMGPAPTVGRLSRSVEAHLIDDGIGDVYGRSVPLECRQRLRDIVHFGSTEALVSQMKQDVQQVKELAENW